MALQKITDGNFPQDSLSATINAAAAPAGHDNRIMYKHFGDTEISARIQQRGQPELRNIVSPFYRTNGLRYCNGDTTNTNYMDNFFF
jgi:hypothetical protein